MQILEFRVPLFPTAYRVASGHRLRLAIAGAHFPVLLSAPVNPTLTIHRSRERPSRLLLPVGDAAGRRAGAPALQPPLAEDPEALILHTADHRLSRDLFGGAAAHQHRRREVHRLEGGTTLQTEMETTATISVGAPRAVQLQGSRILTVESAGSTILVRTNMAETFDRCHLAADVAVDGNEVFRRSWELDMRGAKWNLQGRADPGPA